MTVPTSKLSVIRRGMLAAAWLVPAIWMAVSAAPGAQAAEEHPGRQIYTAHCDQCHGPEGDGRGHAFDAVFPRPRDFTSGLFKFRTTESGEYPIPADLVQIIRNGMPGTSMPGWKTVLSDADIQNVAAYVERFYREEDDDAPEVLAIPDAPPATPERVAWGGELFKKLECYRCHGEEGRGDGYNSMTLKEDWNGEPIYPRNLTAGWLFRGGRRPRDVYRTVMFGLTGTPMPAHNEEEILAREDDRWALVHYVLSLGPDHEPKVKSTIVAHRIAEPPPLDPDHDLWREAPAAYIPLAGQVILEPRLFQSGVRYLWVQSLYSEHEIGFRLRWVDPTSMDNEALKEALKPKEEEGEGEEVEKKNGGKAAAANEARPIPVDELIVQFPAKYKPGETLPYFLMGKPGKKARLWVWRSDRDGMAEATSSALGRIKARRGGSKLASALRYRNGEYTLTVKRKRQPEDPGGPAFGNEPGVFPISFSALDGFKGEGGTRRGVATWYDLLLERPAGARVYLLPLLVALVFIGLEWRLLHHTRRRAAEKGKPVRPARRRKK